MKKQLYVVTRDIYKYGEFDYSEEIFFTSHEEANQYALEYDGVCRDYGAIKREPSKYYYPNFMVDVTRNEFTYDLSEYEIALKYGYIKE